MVALLMAAVVGVLVPTVSAVGTSPTCACTASGLGGLLWSGAGEEPSVAECCLGGRERCRERGALGRGRQQRQKALGRGHGRGHTQAAMKSEMLGFNGTWSHPPRLASRVRSCVNGDVATRCCVEECPLDFYQLILVTAHRRIARLRERPHACTMDTTKSRRLTRTLAVDGPPRIPPCDEKTRSTVHVPGAHTSSSVTVAKGGTT